MIQITSRYTLSSLYDTYLLYTRNIPNWEQGELKVPQTLRYAYKSSTEKS